MSTISSGVRISSPSSWEGWDTMTACTTDPRHFFLVVYHRERQKCTTLSERCYGVLKLKGKPDGWLHTDERHFWRSQKSKDDWLARKHDARVRSHAWFPFGCNKPVRSNFILSCLIIYFSICFEIDTTVLMHLIICFYQRKQRTSDWFLTFKQKRLSFVFMTPANILLLYS